MNQAAALYLAHLRAKRLRAKEIAGEVDRQHQIPFGERQRVERPGPQDRRGIDQHLRGTERFLDRRGGGGDAVGMGDVTGHDHMAVACELRAGFLQPLLVAIQRRDLRAGLRQIDRHRAADAAARAGHHADAAGEAQPVG